MVEPRDVERENFIMDDKYPEAAGPESNPDSDYAPNSDIFKKKPIIPIVIGSLGFVILVILVVRIFSAPRNTVDLDYVQSLETRIHDLENQLLKREDLDQTHDRIEQQDSRVDAIKQKLDGFEKTVTIQIDQLIQEIVVLQQKRARAPSAVAPRSRDTAKKQSQTSPIPTAIRRFHVVQSGETLYRISRRYGLSVDQLRSFNNLAADAAIYPGQKLKIEKP
jgi:LysM repeat protein